MYYSFIVEFEKIYVGYPHLQVQSMRFYLQMFNFTIFITLCIRLQIHPIVVKYLPLSIFFSLSLWPRNKKIGILKCVHLKVKSGSRDSGWCLQISSYTFLKYNTSGNAVRKLQDEVIVTYISLLHHSSNQVHHSSIF